MCIYDGCACASPSSFPMPPNTNLMVLVVFTGGPMRRSHSKGALFNDQVYEVPILKSPARKTCLRTGIYESGVQVPWHTQQHY